MADRWGMDPGPIRIMGSLVVAMLLVVEGCASPPPTVVHPSDLSFIRSLAADSSDAFAAEDYRVVSVEVREGAVTVGLMAERRGHEDRHEESARCRRADDRAPWNCEVPVVRDLVWVVAGREVEAVDLGVDAARGALRTANEFVDKQARKDLWVTRLRGADDGRIVAHVMGSPGHAEIPSGTVVLRRVGSGWEVDEVALPPRTRDWFGVPAGAPAR